MKGTNPGVSDIKFFCPRWGSEHLSWEVFFTRVKKSGYDGVEYGISAAATRNKLDEVWELATRNDLLLIAQHYDTNQRKFEEHFQTYAEWLKKISAYPWFKVSSQTGRDFFSFEQNKMLIDLAGEKIIHETHRGKFSFAAHVTKEYLEKMPGLYITLDISHWVNVAESFLEDQPEAVQIAIERTQHLHARVGYPEGPQIPDPRAPEWQEALEKHLVWWDQVVKVKPDITITPEFGPYPYLVHLPYSRQPIADQWEMNLFMMNLLKKRYA